MFSCGDLPSKNNEKEHMDLFSVFPQQLKTSIKPPYDFAPPSGDLRHKNPGTRPRILFCRPLKKPKLLK
jgi:hypothetical protein